jgi:hypothetical protein
MFGVAAKRTECAILIGRRSRLATGTCTNKVERLMNGWATIRSPWKKNVATRVISQCGKGVKDQPLALSYTLNKYDCNMETINPHKSIDYMIRHSAEYAQAKAQVTYLEEFRKSKKAMLFSTAIGNTIADKDNYAYSHPEYLAVLDGLKEAVEKAETLRWMLVAAQARIDVWRSQEASNRGLDRATQ